jgi:LPS sulfotransferase NodH
VYWHPTILLLKLFVPWRPKAVSQNIQRIVEMEEETVTISVHRLKELEQAAALLVTVQEKLNKRMNNSVERMNAYNKENPRKAAERSKKCKAENREAYNARRRELYHLRRGASTAVDATN